MEFNQDSKSKTYKKETTTLEDFTKMTSQVILRFKLTVVIKNLGLGRLKSFW